VVVCQLATANEDRRYGARHLQRNIETLLLEPLALNGPRSGKAVAAITDGEVTFSGKREEPEATG